MSQLDQARAMIQQSRHIAVLSGAGISQESGVPTFRDAAGMWHGHDPMKLATMEAFLRNPELVWEFYNTRRQKLAECEPNAGHYALAELANTKRVSIATQNVDRFHQQAGSQEVVELHGNIWECRCSYCGCTQDYTGRLFNAIPLCPKDQMKMRPAVVWFGESLPPGAFEQAEEWATIADILLIVGTSGVVWPAAGLAYMARDAGTKIIEVNKEKSAVSETADLTLLGPSAEILPQICFRD